MSLNAFYGKPRAPERHGARFAPLLLLSLAFGLTSCGGGGSTSSPAPSPTPTPTPTPTPPPFPRYDELSEETDLRASTLTLIDSILNRFRLEPVASSTVRVDPVADTLTLFFAGQSVTVGEGDLVSRDDDGETYELVEGSVRRRVTTFRPEVSGARVDYLRLFTAGATEIGTNNPVGDLVFLLGGIETSDSDVVAQGGGRYSSLLRGFGRFNSVPGQASEATDDVNTASVVIDATNRTVSVTFDFEGVALNDPQRELEGGVFGGDATLSSDGSRFEGVLDRIDAGGESEVGTFAGAFYGPGAEEVAVQFEIDTFSSPEVVFGGQIYGRRD